MTPATASSAPHDAVPTEDATTALVFDHLSAETLRLAQKATLDYVPLTGESSARVGVFATEPRMHVVQRFTNKDVLSNLEGVLLSIRELASARIPGAPPSLSLPRKGGGNAGADK